MSHQPERKERDCLNCGTEVLGPYCQACGQKNVVPHQTFWQLFTHFIYDILHFDSKFFDTLKYLLLKPGFVPKEYVQGRRFSYLDPIRMYLFTSAVFFLIFFSIENIEEGIAETNTTGVIPAEIRTEILNDIKDELVKKPGDTALVRQPSQLQDTTKPITYSELYPSNGTLTFEGLDSNIKSVQQYDSLQKALPAAKQDNWLRQKFNKRALAIQSKYGTHLNKCFQDAVALFIHKLPYMLFVSLPFFALILKLLYVRRKSYYYSDHAVFTLYHYIFSFMLLLFLFLLNALAGWTHVKLFKTLIPLLALTWPVYLFIAMKRFYGQGGFKTFSKFLLLNILALFVLLLLFVLFFFYSLLQL